MPRLLLALFLLALIFVGVAPSKAGSPDVELRVLGYSRWVAGGPASLRVIAYDPATSRGVEGVPVEVVLNAGDGGIELPLLSGTTNMHGTLDAQFTVPARFSGSATLRVKREGAAPLETAVHVTRQERVFLSTDKPLYQPGQSINVRALALREPTLVPIGDTPVVLEVEDSRGNKVFKRKGRTSRFGVFSARFDLATEVNMGEYRVRCTLDGTDAEKSFTVKRYVLPKFKIGVKTAKAWYQPGESVKGTVQADYFFGKPVAGAKVVIEAKAFDVAEREVGRIEGTTDGSGGFAFEMPLPEWFAGRPLDKGKASVSLVARVQDAAAHAEESGAQVAVVSSPVSVELFPESGRLVPGLPNRIYVITTRPDGTAVPATVAVQIGGFQGTVQTDATGFGELGYEPPAVASRGVSDVNATLTAKVSVRDRQGAEGSFAMDLQSAQQSDSILIRPEKALYRVGDVFRATVLSTKPRGSVYVDMIRDDQTIMTRSVELSGGRGTLSFALTPQTYGALQVNAYQILSTSDTVRDTRRIFVQPAKDLRVEVSLDRGSYRPGEDAKVTFMVKDSGGAPSLAVLGVDVVDESLFALAERQPGLERVYFLLEKAMMEARYEVHGLSLEDVARGVDDGRATKLSSALFTKMPAPAQYTLRLDSFDVKLAQMYQRMMRAQNAVHVWRQTHGAWPERLEVLVDAGKLAASDLVDPWGRKLRLRSLRGIAMVCSVGADGLFGSTDDVDVQMAYGRGDFDQRRRAGGPMGGAGGVMEDGVALPQATAMPEPAMREKASKDDRSPRDQVATGRREQPGVRIRQYFPETLFVAPEVVTDETGRAVLTVPMADSITTWRLTAFASSLTGRMGNGGAGIRVFQDFFVDLDVPAALTQGDVVSVPVALYNYLPEAQNVTLTLEKAEWYELLGDATRTVTLQANEVSGASFQVRALRPGTFPFTLRASGTKLSDAVRRSVTVMPDGRELVQVKSDRLQGTVKTVIDVPSDAVAGASRLLVTLYPGVFSQVVEGLDSILRMPGGCFEQTSSSTYPNVLVTDYLKRARKATPEIQMKAEGFINAGYQRLLTFEVSGGGFSVFGQAPANPILTAYGLMEFADMARVHEVDPALIARTRSWLLAQQGKDGSWGAGKQGFYAEGWSNVPNSSLVSTAYITWALVEAGEKGEGLQRAVQYLKEHAGEATEPYTAALVANALMQWNPRDAVARKALASLVAMRTEEKDVVSWRTRIATAAYGTGRAGDIETTALAAMALSRSTEHGAMASRALAWLVRSKDAFGTWESTQATVLSMKALLGGMDRAAEKIDAKVRVVVNGAAAGTVRLTAENFDVFQQLDVSRFVRPGANHVALVVEGQGAATYRLAAHYWRPWEAAPVADDVLGIDVTYDRTTLSKDDSARCLVKAVNRTKRVANQVMLDVGVPPGFDVQSEDLEKLVKAGVIQKFSLTGRQVIVYLDKIDGSATVQVSYRVRARYPVRAQAPASTVYEYYNPDRRAVDLPQIMTIQ